MRVGTVCYATSRGLGHLARDFRRHGLVTDTYVVRHPSVPTNADWYPNAPWTPLKPFRTDEVYRWCLGLDALLLFETPFDWHLLRMLRGKVRTFLVTMYECTPRFHTAPDVYLCPSDLDLRYFPREKSVRVRLPVEYPWRLRTRAEHFVHNGGYLGVKAKGRVMREGTTTLIEAMRHVRSPVRLTIRVQENVPAEYLKVVTEDARIDYHAGTVPYEALYATGDVAVGCQRWNGCSLPLQEAFASGMLVMNTDRFPANTWLPRGPLIPCPGRIEDSSIGGPYTRFDEADPDPHNVAAAIDKWYGTDITEYSLAGKKWAEENSWAALLPEWKETLSR